MEISRVFQRLIRTLRYGSGYTLQFTFSDPSNVSTGIEFLHDRFPTLSNIKCHHRTISCHIPDEQLSIILAHVLANKQEMALADFSFRETSLDEVLSSQTPLNNDVRRAFWSSSLKCIFNTLTVGNLQKVDLLPFLKH
jgi:hypothetical protein